MEKDGCSKAFYSVNERFADLINGLGCKGKQIVKAVDLKERDTQTGIWKMTGLQRKRTRSRAHRNRDLIRKTAFGMNFAVIGIENQEEVDYALPLRVLAYDVGEYERQAADIRQELKQKKGKLSAGEFLYGFTKDSRLYPVVTFVLYYGEEDWDGSRDLHGMIDFSQIPEELQEFVQNSQVHLVEVRKMKDTSVFHTDVRQVFDFIRCAGDKEALKQLAKQDPAFQNMEEDAYQMLALYAKAENLIGKVAEYKKGGKVNMCKALEDMVEEGRQEGRQEGIKVLVETCKEFGVSDMDTIRRIKEKYDFSEEEAAKLVNQYW